MSDNIVINITPSQSDYININETTSLENLEIGVTPSQSNDINISVNPLQSDPVNVNVSTSIENIDVDISQIGNYVISVNGKTGIVVLTKDDIGLNYVDNTSDWLKPISYATLTSISGLQNLIYDLIALSGLWDSVYTNVSNNSSNWNSVYSYTNSSSAFSLEVNTLVSSNSANWNSPNQVQEQSIHPFLLSCM